MPAKKQPIAVDEAKTEPKQGIATFQYAGKTYYAWRDDGVKPTITEDVTHNIHMILNTDAQHWSTEKP